jgi:hypothetical protein
MRPATPRPNFYVASEANGALLAEPAMLRLSLLFFAGFLGLAGVWLLVSALLVPQAIALPLDKESAAAAGAYRSSAVWAARLGVIRGDLYKQAAFAAADLVWVDPARSSDPVNAARLQRARSNGATALSLAPVNGAVWLLLAELPAPPSKAAEASATAALQMSYLTAPTDPGLALPRLQRALAFSTPLDKDLQEFVKGDLRHLLLNSPRQYPAIVAAYKAASPQNQAILEALAAEVDPRFNQYLRGETPK